MTYENPGPEELIDVYGDEAPVVIGDGVKMSLGQALKMEQMFCPAEVTARQDPVKRVAYLAGMLAAADTLRPEHAYLLLPGEPK